MGNPETHRRRRHSRSSGLFGPMRSAFEDRDPERLLAAYDELIGGRLSLRLLGRLIELAYPVRAALAWAGRIERSIARQGLPKASQRFLQSAIGSWGVSVSPLSTSTFRDGPTIFYGNHPSLLTPFLVAAQLDRDDFRSVSTKYVCHLLPSFGELSFPVEIPLIRPVSEWQPGNVRRSLVFALVALLRRQHSLEEVKSANRRSMQEAAEHVQSGGCLIICPDGGEPRRRDWYPGIGIIAKALAEQGVADNVRLVPFCEVNSTNHRITAILRHGPIARIRRTWYARKPVRIVFGDPLLLSQIAPPERTVEQIVHDLFHRYRDAFDRA